MINSSVYKRILLAFGVIFFIACDRDFNELDSDIIEDDIHHDNMTRMLSNVVAFDRPTGPVQSNNLPINSLGIFNNEAFGTTTAHFVTQVRLDPGNPTFTTNVNIERVYLYVPYESRLISVNADGVGTYELDSIYGNTPDAAMRLNIYENKFFLRDSDPGTTFLSGQRYYSNDFDLIHDNRNPVRLNDNASNPAQNDQFKIRATQIDRSEPTEEGGDDTEIVERLAPGIFADLNKDFFKSKIINAPAGKLVNHSVFKEWFRGIYFNIEDIGNGGAMASMNFKKGKIVIIYYQDEVAGTEGTPSANRAKKTLTLDMNPGSSTTLNTVNFFVNNYNTDFLNAINTSNDDLNGDGDNRLYLKGGNGSMAFIHLNDTDILGLREENMGRKVVINEANLTFHVDQALMGDSERPLRIYLYDVENKRPLYDYYTDVTSNATNSKRNKSVHGGIVGLNKEQDGHQYKIRITNYINNIVNHDSVSRPLGLVITENINFVGSAALRNAVNTGGTGTTTTLPAASVISPAGVILYGSKPGAPEDEDKRLKLEIFYTKPN